MENSFIFTEGPEDVRVRKYGELVANAVSSVTSALEIPKEMIKDSVRPDYWVKDSENQNCFLCEFKFGDNEELNQTDLNHRESTSSGSSQESPVHRLIDGKIHHCRSCGQAVCNKCSLNRKPVSVL